MKKLTEPGQKLQIDFTGKLHDKKINGDMQILIAVDRFSKWLTVKTCKTAETKEVINFLTNNFNLYGILEKIKPDEGGAFVSNMKKPKYKNILHTPVTYAKRGGRKRDTKFKKPKANKSRRSE